MAKKKADTGKLLLDIEGCRNPVVLIEEYKALKAAVEALGEEGTNKERGAVRERFDRITRQICFLSWDDLRGFYWEIVYKVFLFQFKNLHIKDKQTNKVTPFRLNSAQRQVLAIIAKKVSCGDGVYLFILKARQIGFTTFIEGMKYLITRNSADINAAVLAHKDKSGAKIFKIFQRYHMRDKFALDKKYSSKKILEYKEHSSQIEVYTGQSSDEGRGETLNLIHFSEAAFYRAPEELIPAMLACVPKGSPNTFVAVESTANGVGGWFYDNWCNEGGPWEKIFVPWHTHNEYSYKFLSKKEEADFVASLTQKEKDMLEAVDGMTPGKLKWRRDTIALECPQDPDMFMQEYPMTEEEAFLHSGRPVFQVDDVMRHRKFIVSEWADKDLEPEKYEISVGVTWDGFRPDLSRKGMHRNKDGAFTVFERPKSKYFYAVACDVAEGLEVTDRASSRAQRRQRYDTDYSVISVGRYPYERTNGKIEKGREVAVWRGKLPPYDLAEILYYICLWYNSANVGIEANNHGITVVDRMYRVYNYPANKFKKHTTAWNERGNRVTESDRMGWLTGPNTRPVLIDHIIEDVQEDLFEFQNQELFDEMSTFVYDNKGKAQHQDGRHDDIIFATAIMRQVMRTMKAPDSGRRADPGDVDERITDLVKYRKLKAGQSFNGMTVTG